MKTISRIFFLATLLPVTASGQGTILWDEGVSGPLSQFSSSPTPLPPLQLGTNTVIGMTEVEPTGPSWSVYTDFFTFAVPNNSVVGTVYLQINKPNVWTWIGEPTFFDQLAFSFSPSTGNLSSQWGLSSIVAGTYGMYFENHDFEAFTSIANYRLDFFVQSIPEPSSLWLLVGGLGLIGIHRWKRRV